VERTVKEAQGEQVAEAAEMAAEMAAETALGITSQALRRQRRRPMAAQAGVVGEPVGGVERAATSLVAMVRIMAAEAAEALTMSALQRRGVMAEMVALL